MILQALTIFRHLQYEKMSDENKDISIQCLVKHENCCNKPLNDVIQKFIEEIVLVIRVQRAKALEREEEIRDKIILYVILTSLKSRISS